MAMPWTCWRWTPGPDFNQRGGYFRERNGHFERWDRSAKRAVANLRSLRVACADVSVVPQLLQN